MIPVGGIWPGNGKSPRVTVFHDSSRWEFLKLPGWTKATNSAPHPYSISPLPFHFSQIQRELQRLQQKKDSLLRDRVLPWQVPVGFFKDHPKEGLNHHRLEMVLIVSCGFPITTYFPDIVWHKAPHVYPMLGSTRTIKRDLELLKPCQDKHSDDEGTIWIILFFVWGKPENLMVQSLIFPTNIWQ